MHAQRLARDVWLLDVVEKRMYNAEHISKYVLFDSRTQSSHHASTITGFDVRETDNSSYKIPSELQNFGIRCDTILNDLQDGLIIPFIQENNVLTRVNMNTVIETVNISEQNK